jgi:hypothetical protein
MPWCPDYEKSYLRLEHKIQPGWSVGICQHCRPSWASVQNYFLEAV